MDTRFKNAPLIEHMQDSSESFEVAEFIKDVTKRLERLEERFIKAEGGNDFSYDKAVEERLSGIFREIGLAPNMIGYKYIKTAVKLVVKDETVLSYFTKGIYHEIAARYKTTPTGVERAIRNAIEKLFAKGDYEAMDKYFGNMADVEKGKLTNKGFIAVLADTIIRDCGEPQE